MSSSGFKATLIQLCLLLALLCAPAARADPVLLDASSLHERISLRGHLEFYFDASGALSQEQIASADYAQRFTPLADTFNGGFARGGAWWLRFAVKTADRTPGDWWLHLAVPYVDFVDVWLPTRDASGNPVLRHRALGGLRPVSGRDLPWSTSVLRLSDLPDGESQWIWIRLAGERTISLTGDIWKLDGLTNELQLITFEVAAVIGMMALMTVVCLLLGISLPDRKFLWYSAYLGASTLLFLCSENFLSVLFLPDQPLLTVRMHNISMCLSLLTSIVFARSLLEMETQFPRIGKVFQGLTVLSLIACALAVAGYYSMFAAGLNIFRLLFAVIIVVLCAILVRRRTPSAWPNFIGYAVYGGVGIMHFAKNLDWLPYSLLTQYSYLIGVVVHMLAIFLGLGLRVRNRERQALADSLVAGAKLETRVAERTAELQQAQAKLQQAMQEQRNFLSMVSHEFRTPLSIIGASAELMTDERIARNLQDTQREAAKIGRAKQRMLGLVDTLLADEWLESSTMQLSCRDLELAELLQDICDEHADSSGRDIRLDVQCEDSTIHADERLLHIVFDNLIENAIKYSPGGTAIELRIWREAQRILVTVRDHGPGLKDAETEQVFERYYRSQEIKRLPGIGLGLFMVKRIAVLHGGSVQAGNANGGGAVFTVGLSGTDLQAGH